MRYLGTKYEPIEKLPMNAEPVSVYARSNNIAVGYVYVKYERFINNKGKDPGYTIRSFYNSNFVIPN